MNLTRSNNTKAFFYTISFTIIFSGLINGQNFLKDFEHNYGSDTYVEIVRDARDSLYNQVLSHYNNLYISKKEIDIFIEKCKFIDKVFFDEDEYYNPKYLEFESCIEDLIQEYPNHSDAIIYYHFNQYEDSSITKLETLINQLSSKRIDHKPKLLWLANEKLARHYSNQDDYDKALVFAKDAMSLNDSLDLSALQAEQYLAKGMEEKAKDILIKNLDSTRTNELYKKATIFKELEDYESALKVFRWLERSEEGWELSEELGNTLMKLEMFDEARPYLLEASTHYWGKRKALQSLYEFDLNHSVPDSLKKSYSQMRDEGLWADPFGVFKLRMILKRGVLSFEWRDMIALFSYLVLLLVIILSPYFWVVPIYAYGKWRNDGTIDPNLYPSRWELKHFWYISSFFLFASFCIEIFLNYSDFVALMNDEFISEEITDTLFLANTVLLFDLLMIIGTLAVLKFKDIRFFVGDKKNWKHEIMLGLAFLFIVRIIFGVTSSLFEGAENSELSLSSSYLEQAILGVVDHYGTFVAFLSVVIVAPFLEEIQFRGIMLGSASKYLPFWAANMIQSILFVLVHENLSLFVFYFAFGMCAGYLRKRTGGFLAPVTLHVLNNTLAFFWIVYGN